MGIEDLTNQAKDALEGHKDEVDGAIDKAKALIEDKTPDQVDGLVDKAADAAKGLLG